MAIRLIDSTMGVPSGWSAIDPDTKTKIQGHSFRSLRATWITHRKDNNLPTEQVEEWVQEQICAKNPTYCSEKGIPPIATPGGRLSLTQMITNTAQELAKWARAGFPVTTEEEVQKRAQICQACEFWDPYAYGRLGKCKKCQCSGAKHMLKTSRCPIGLWE